MKISKQSILLALAIIGGMGAAATALAQSGDTLESLCYRGRLIQVPSYLVQRYVLRGASAPVDGGCPATPPGQ